MLHVCSNAAFQPDISRQEAVPEAQRSCTIFAGTIMKMQLAGLVIRTEQRTLYPRVRGSSPWRRTRTDLGFHSSRSFLCARFAHMLAPCSLVSHDRVATGSSRTAAIGRVQRRPAAVFTGPMVCTFAEHLVHRLPGTATQRERCWQQPVAGAYWPGGLRLSRRSRARADDGIGRRP